MEQKQRQIVGIRVKQLRKDLSLTQVELGRRVGLAKGTISNIENGTQGISRIADRLAQALGTTTDYLYGLTENPLPPEEDEEAERPAANPLRDAVFEEFEKLDDVDRRALYQIAVTLRLAREQRDRYRVVE